LLRELYSRISELKGSETDRFLKFLAILNTLLEQRNLGRLIIVGGFAAEFYSGRGYRTGDVDIIVEGQGAEIVRLVLSEISDKGIDIVGTVYSLKKQPLSIYIDGYKIYIIPPEEVILTYLEAWKFWESSEDKIKAVLVYCAQRSKLDFNYLKEEAERRGVSDYLEKLNEYC